MLFSGIIFPGPPTFLPFRDPTLAGNYKNPGWCIPQGVFPPPKLIGDKTPHPNFHYKIKKGYSTPRGFNPTPPLREKQFSSFLPGWATQNFHWDFSFLGKFFILEKLTNFVFRAFFFLFRPPFRFFQRGFCGGFKNIPKNVFSKIGGKKFSFRLFFPFRGIRVFFFVFKNKNQFNFFFSH